MWFKIQLTISTRNSSWYANLFTVPFYQDTRIFTKAGQLWKLLLIKPGKTITFSPNSFQLTYFRNLVSLVFKHCLRPVLEVHKSLHEGSTVYSRIYVSCLVNATFEFFLFSGVAVGCERGTAYPQKFWFVENPGKIPENLGKNGAQRCLTSKMAPNVFIKTSEDHFLDVTPKNGRKMLHDNFLGKNPLHPQKFACSCTYVLIH